jgi:sugar/nucleoside kinase (ribokinase family)
MLLDRLDAPDPEDPSRPAGARVLEQARAAGLRTSLDIVTDLGPRLQEVVRPALAHTDYFIANELESGALAGIPLREGSLLLPGNLSAVAEALLDCGVRETVVIHAPEGGWWQTRGTKGMWQPSLRVPPEENRGTAGAGDAFCTGILYGLHEEWDAERTLQLAVANAAQCLSDPTTTDGLRPLADVLALADRFGYRE